MNNGIDVLLAVYRPDPGMLKAQVSSIEQQTDVGVNIICREDVRGEGPRANFSELLKTSKSDYIAFSDQDDVWFPDKLSRSLAELKVLESKYGAETPLLVFTDAKVVDAVLHETGRSLFKHTKINPFRTKPEQLILQNAANGNTMLFNAALRDKASPIPEGAFMHDHWMMLVASTFGVVSHISETTLLYRQHERNVLGGAKVGFHYYVRRLAQGIPSLRQRLYAGIRQAEAFALRYPDAPPCFKACIGFEKRNWLMRRWLLLRHGIFKNGFIRNLGTFVLI